MTLTIDVGNSNIAGGVFDGDKLILQFRQTTHRNSTSDEIGIFLRSVLRENSIDPAKITQIGICSVVPQINYSLSSAILKYFGCEPLFIQAGIKTGLKLKVANPKEVGADLIANGIGAASIHNDKDIIIVDLGTATTIQALSKDKDFLGVSILPGLKMSVQSLVHLNFQMWKSKKQTRHAELPQLNPFNPESILVLPVQSKKSPRKLKQKFLRILNLLLSVQADLQEFLNLTEFSIRLSRNLHFTV